MAKAKPAPVVEEEPLTISRDDAVDLLVGLQFPTAGEWTAEVLGNKLADIENVATADTPVKHKDKKRVKYLQNLLPQIIEAANGPGIMVEFDPEEAEEVEEEEVAEEEEEEAPAPPAKPKPKAGAAANGKAAAAKPKATAAKTKPAAVADADEAPAKKAGIAAPAKPKAEKKPTAPKQEQPGVRNTRARPYLAGIIIKQHMAEAGANGKPQGLKCGITEAMVAELDEAYGKPNERESMFTLRNAYHAIRGYVTKGNEGDLEGGEGEE